jgi:uncharacterized protein
MARAEMAGAVEALSVTVVYSPRAGEVEEVLLSLGDGATVADAVRESGLLDRHAGIGAEPAAVGVWGVLVALSDRLRDCDRVEIYRPLQVDPKEARRLRQHKQRAQTRR